VYKDHLHDLKTLHMSGTSYRDSKVMEKGVAKNAGTRADKVNTNYSSTSNTRHATSMRSFSGLNQMRTLGQSQRGSAHTRGFGNTAWSVCGVQLRTSTCCCGRRPSPQLICTIGARSVPLLRRQPSQPSRQYTASDWVLSSPCREHASSSRGHI